MVLSESCEPGSYARGPRYEGVVAEVRLVRWYLVRQHIQGTKTKYFACRAKLFLIYHVMSKTSRDY